MKRLCASGLLLLATACETAQQPATHAARQGQPRRVTGSARLDTAGHPGPRARPYQWTAEHERLWKELVPAQGQASTLQGELVRISGKLSDEAYRNGNANWDTDFERMARFVGRHLDDPRVFPADERALIRQSVETIIRDRADPDVSGHGSALYTLSEKVVAWCMAHPEPIPHTPDPSLGR